MTDVLTVVAAAAALRQKLSAHAVRAATAAVAAFDGWYDPVAITAVADQIVANVESTQRQLAAVTDAYLARVATQLAGRTFHPAGAVDVNELRPGITHAGVYGRLADQFRWQVSEGMAADESRQRVLTRAAILADTDVTLAYRQQARVFMVEHKIATYHRVISGLRTCALCVAASTRTYYKADLLPIHSHCHCSVVPGVGQISDTVEEMNNTVLGKLYAAAGSTSREDLRTVTYDVRQHGELGPMLVDPDQHFRSPREVRAAS